MLKLVLKRCATVLGILFLGFMTVEFAVLRRMKASTNEKTEQLKSFTNENGLNYMRYAEKHKGKGEPLTGDFPHKDKTEKMRAGGFLKLIQSEKAHLRHPRKMQAIIIVASFRTGSSFVGQLFNQHPKAFYLFEPLFFTIWNRDGGEATSKIIENLLLCNLSSMRYENFQAWKKAKKEFEKEKNQKTYKNLLSITECLKSSFCFRGKSKALCTREMCGNRYAKNCQKHCQRPPEDQVRKYCLDAKIRVLKVIRLDDLDTLERSYRNEHIDIKVIHLVRDPRSTLLSRLRLTKDVRSNVTDIVKSTCQRNFRMHSSYISNGTNQNWLKSRYRLLRYEDVITDPIGEVERLYNFLKIPMFSPSPYVTSWLESSTSSSDFDLFGTNRDTYEQKYKWRLQIPFELAESVQSECKNMMELLGYKPAVSKSHLIDLTQSLLAEINGQKHND